MIIFSCIKSDVNTFPNSWDSNRNLRGNNGEVLAWTHKKVKSTSLEYKSCITIVAGVDSSGKDEYYISQTYSNEKPFNKWNISSIHFGPDSNNNMGFYDLHIEEFDSIPSKQEIYNLLDRWMFELNDYDDWTTIEMGIDEDLWSKYFGFIPDSKDL